ncbi:ATP-binding protein [Caulobacter sp. 17J65-9]|uniref:ATP-binding protein n=1 Tax=Caulobacter sp. 17J65-9 TaxID=2709382 RepID=UPI0013C99918|nr:response regulator [Caulobacter sp. 17J65-9]
MAALVCLAAALTAFRLYAKACAYKGGLRATWIGFTGVAAGAGVWATHFIAVLAYEPGFRTGYALGPTALSLLVAIASTAAGFGLASFGGARWRAAGGALLGLGVGAMHYTGMSGLRTEGVLSWDPGLVLASLVVGASLSIAALFAAGAATSWRRSAGAAVLYMLAICSLHFTGMGAITIVPDSSAAVPPELLDHHTLAVAVTSLAVMILCAAVGATVMEGVGRRDSLRSLRGAVEAMPQAMCLFDAEDRCVIWNSRYEALNTDSVVLLRPGLPFREMLEADLAAGQYPEAAGREAEWLDERLAARRNAPCTLEQRTADGRWIRVEDRRAADGGVVSVLTDVTDLKRDAEVLAQARDAAEAANRAKSEFLANMSHEIRTPLNGVLGVADVLAGRPMAANDHELVEVIRASGRTLERLLSDVLDLARVESGRLDIHAEAFDLGDAVCSVAALAVPQAEAKGVALKVEAAIDADHVSGDPVRLKQVLANLISNAVKFTERGEVTVRVVRNGDVYEFAVRDTGLGFDAATKARLFDRFEQADGSITRQFGGAGLGLAISRQLVELMGGRLECDSTPGAGSTFTFALPLPPAPKASPAVGADRALRVLLADDHPTNRRVVELVLDQAGVELTAVADGRAALEAFRVGAYDAVLMDMQMPVMDGLTATRAIRDYERERGLVATPVIMLTANALPEHVEAALDAGAVRHLPKPISAPGLLTALAEVVDERDAA